MIKKILIENVQSIYGTDDIAFRDIEVSMFGGLDYLGLKDKLKYDKKTGRLNTGEVGFIGHVESSILNYLLETNFAHVYVCETIIFGFSAFCFILDERKAIEYLKNITDERSFKGFKIDEFPILNSDFAYPHRLLCAIRQKEITNEKSEILIYSYSNNYTTELIKEGYYNFRKCVFQIDYCAKTLDSKMFGARNFKYLIFEDGEENARHLQVFDISKDFKYCYKLEFFYNSQVNRSFSEIDEELKNRNNVELENPQKLFSNYTIHKYIDLNLVRLGNQIVVNILLDPKIDNVIFNNYPCLKFDDPKDDRILFASIRESLFVLYKGFDISLLDEKQNISTAVDSFFIYGNDKELKRGYINSWAQRKSKVNFLFYNDEEKNILQLPIANLSKVPYQHGVSIKKVGRFYYHIFGFSITYHRRLVDLHENYYLEYNFRNKEIIGHVVNEYYDDKR